MRPLLFTVDVFLPMLRRRNFRYFPLVSRYKSFRRASSRHLSLRLARTRGQATITEQFLR